MKILSPILNIPSKFKASKDFTNLKPDKNSSFLHLNRKGIIKNVSDEFINLTGYKRSNLKGKNISSIIYKGKKNVIISLIKELSADAPFAQTKVKLEDVHQNVINIELYLTLTSLKEGAPIFAILRKSGIHQEKYNHLFEKKEKLRMLAENSREVQVLFDTDMLPLYVSPSCLALTGYKYSELINTELHNYVHYDDLDKFWDSIKHATHHGKSFLVFRIKTRSGGYVYAEGHAQAITDEFNCITHYALYIHDASQRIQYEQQLLKSKSESEIAKRIKNQFLTSVSHEFRTPLNAIIGFSRIMEKTVEDPDLDTYLKNIEISGIQLLDMVNNLLSFSKIEKEEIETNITPIHVSSFFKNLEKNISNKFSAIENSKVTISCNVETFNCGEFIYSDEAILKIIFENLVNNAVKFTKEGFIKYGVKPYGINNYLFYVEDSGVGIAKEYQEKVFETLTQQDGSLTRKYSGLGIGLSVTKKMVDLLDGEIWVISDEGEGAKFYFTIPSRTTK